MVNASRQGNMKQEINYCGGFCLEMEVADA